MNLNEEPSKREQHTGGLKVIESETHPALLFILYDAWQFLLANDRNLKF